MILWARIRLAPVSSPFLSVDTDRVADLDEALAALRAPGGPHRVAWLDLLGPRAGRGVVTRAEHLPGRGRPVRRAGHGDGASPRHRAGPVARRAAAAGRRPRLQRAAVPALPGRAQRGRVESLGAHMFPLDALDAWPRLYGRPGFVQYQLVVPYGAERALEDVLAELRRARVPCYLAVLKDFGEASRAPLSFPLAGWTLALDLPRAAPGPRRRRSIAATSSWRAPAAASI